MSMTNRAVGLLRVLLVLLFAGLILGQTLSFPGQFAYMAREEPALAGLRWPLTIGAVLGMLCIQVVIVCTWKLLTLVREDRIFSEESLRWVDGIVWAFGAAWLLLAGGAGALVLTIYFTPELRDPGVPVALGGMVLVGAVLALLIVVLRALLRQATALRSDMDGVV